MSASYALRFGATLSSLALVVSAVQAADEKPPQQLVLNDLRTPSAPGFVMLGVEPTSIERPTTPKAFAASVLSAVSAGDGLPRNYAVELAPYWLVSHPELTFDDYYGAGVGQTFLQTLSLSLATSTAEDSSSPVERTGLGFGARAQLLSGGPSSALAGLRKNLEAKQIELLRLPDPEDEPPSAAPSSARAKLAAEATTLRTDRERLRAERERLSADAAELDKFRDALKPDELVRRQADLTRKLEALRANQTELEGREADRAAALSNLEADEAAGRTKTEAAASDSEAKKAKILGELRALAQQVQAADKQRLGLSVDVAAAVAIDFLGGDVDTGEWRRWGVWLTPAYRLETPRLDILAVGRFVRDSIDEENAADTGARVLLQAGRFGVSAEYVQRFGITDEEDKTYRATGTVEYQVSDSAYLTATFGKNFSDQSTPQGNLISLLCLNIGFGPDPTLKF